MYLQYLAAFAVFLNYLSFFLSVIIVFKKEGAFNQIKLNTLKITSLTFWSYSLYLLVTTQSINFKLLIPYIFIQFTIHFLFWTNTKYVKNKFSIIHSKEEPTVISTEGPYRKVRHPFYSLYMLTYVTTALVLNNVYIFIFCSVLIAQYVHAAINEEKVFIEIKKNEYLRYKEKTWMFIPFIY